MAEYKICPGCLTKYSAKFLFSESISSKSTIKPLKFFCIFAVN